MSLREFIGSDGRRWKAWDVTAAHLHPKTRAEDYMRDLADGWIVFERIDGEEKRRLCPYPAGWDEWPDEEIAKLCDGADQVKRRATPALGLPKIGESERPRNQAQGADIWTARAPERSEERRARMSDERLREEER